MPKSVPPKTLHAGGFWHAVFLATAFVCLVGLSSCADTHYSQLEGPVKRELSTEDDVIFDHSRILKFADGAVIQLIEKRGASTKKAELRGKGGNLELWVFDGKRNFLRGDAKDEVWKDQFLEAINIPAFELSPISPERFNQFIQSEREGVDHAEGRISSWAKSPHERYEYFIRDYDLTPSQQVQLIESIFNHAGKVDEASLLTRLIAKPTFSRQARQAIIDRFPQLDLIQKDSVQQALNKWSAI